MCEIKAKDPVDLAGRIRAPRLARLYAYWLERKAGRRFPRRRDIDPLDFSYLLGNVMLVEVQHAPLRFVVRLHGSEMAERARYDLTGKRIDGLPDAQYRAYVLDRCTRLVAAGEPLVVQYDRVLDDRRQRYEALWLPFSEDGDAVTMLLCALIYEPDAGPRPAKAGFAAAGHASAARPPVTNP